MSLMKRVAIQCDGPNCLWWDEDGESRYADEARSSGRRRGWKRKDGKDYCPDCWKKIREPIFTEERQ